MIFSQKSNRRQVPCTRKPRAKKTKRLGPPAVVASRLKKRHAACPLCPFTSSSDMLVAKHFFEAHWERTIKEHEKMATPGSSVPRSVTRKTIRRMFNKYSHKRVHQKNIFRQNHMVQTASKIVVGADENRFAMVSALYDCISEIIKFSIVFICWYISVNDVQRDLDLD